MGKERVQEGKRPRPQSERPETPPVQKTGDKVQKKSEKEK